MSVPGGEFTAHMLALFDRRRVPDALLHPSTAEIPLTPTLGSQSEAWLSSILHPTRIQATWLPQTSAASLQFRDLDVTADWVRPANVGFGLTYCLPIIVAALGSTPGAVFIVENPEAHLHPRAQSEIGKFLVRLAASGVQTIVETHSDHVLNGVRVAVAAEQLLSPDDVAIHFFGAPGTGCYRDHSHWQWRSISLAVRLLRSSCGRLGNGIAGPSSCLNADSLSTRALSR